MSTSAPETDVLVIGGGPAGLAAATGLVRQLHTVILFDSGKYRNWMSKHMHNVPSWDHRDPAEFRRISREDLISHYETASIENTEITSIKEIEGGFEVGDANGRLWSGKKVILATGVEERFPEIDGYKENWGRTIFHCMFCHGYEQRGGDSGVLCVQFAAAMPQMAMNVARHASQLSNSVVMYTNGDEALEKTLIDLIGGSINKIRTDSRKIKRLVAADPGITVEFEDGSSVTKSFLAHAPNTVPRGPLVQQLGLKTGGPFEDIEVSQPWLQTSTKGVFAAGDNMVMAKAVAPAMHNGGIACVAATLQLQAEKHGHPSMV
ncbi:FAD/NAD(P)-binding domain-containing protein [Periconia macrospinosa]|uniref:FAD/NAD(P)-binding domain-containing protein n=1 Tax=Periconia macrospinosa TaxID=97972 RepID=A0A2V1DX09_9PLEO|nr:FAD/NAD(P)-binding domain-containing protein [Periconia macrospinosa]